jgi:hypothetical protein
VSERQASRLKIEERQTDAHKYEAHLRLSGMFQMRRLMTANKQMPWMTSIMYQILYSPAREPVRNVVMAMMAKTAAGKNERSGLSMRTHRVETERTNHHSLGMMLMNS